MSDGEAEEPLLNVSVDVPTEARQEDPEQEENVPNSLQRSLYRNPREAIKWLESEGVKKLGTFRVQVSLIARLPRCL